MASITTRTQSLCKRPELSDSLVKRLTAFTQGYRQNIALLGHAGTGKTALILDILRRFSPQQLLPIYVDIPDRGRERLIRAFVGAVLFQSLSKTSNAAPETLEELLAYGHNHVPRTARACAHILRAAEENNTGIFQQLLSLPHVLCEEMNVPVLLIMDEFQNLDGIGFAQPFFELSNTIMVQKNIMHLLIGSKVFCAERILKEKLSLLFGNFETLYVHPFDPDTARRYIADCAPGITVPAPMKDFLVQITGGYPFYLTLLSEQLRNCCVTGGTQTATRLSLMESLANVIAQEHGIINQMFTHRLNGLFCNGEANAGIEVLLALAKGCRKPSHLAAAIRKPSKEIARLVHRLIHYDVVQKKGSCNEITDPLMGLWLRLVVQRRRNTFDPSRLTAEIYADDLDAIYEGYLQESQKDAAERIQMLFSQFTNDTIQLGNKRFMLSKFDAITHDRNNGVRCLEARRGTARWRCYIESKPITENSIGKTLQAARSAGRSTRNILITLAGIEDNARLKALEAKFLIWDRTILNELMSLYQQPHIIL